MKDVALKLILSILSILGIILAASLMVAVSNAAHVPAHVDGKVVACSEGLSWDTNGEFDMSFYTVYVGTAPGFYSTPLTVPHNGLIVRHVVSCEDWTLPRRVNTTPP